MRIRNVVTILAGAALAASPVAVSAAAPLSVFNSDVRAGASVSGSSQLDGTAIALGLLILVAIVAVAATGDDEVDRPTSP